MTERRVVFLDTTGLHRIHGTVAESTVPAHLTFSEGGRMTCATLVRVEPRYVLYRECDQPLCERGNV